MALRTDKGRASLMPRHSARPVTTSPGQRFRSSARIARGCV